MTIARFDAAAWLPQPTSPDTHQAGWQLVSHWLEGQQRRTGAPAVLFTDELRVGSDRLLKAFTRGTTHFSVRSGGPPTAGPVLAFQPTFKALRAAQRMASSAICVWEHRDAPIRGWAGQVGAIDLTTGLPTPVNQAVQEHLDHLVFAGNNGYADKPGLRDARRILTELHDLGLPTDTIPSSLAAHIDLSTEATKRIAALLTSLPRPPLQPYQADLDQL
ncbi:hypothetical protein [Actinokineospora terrae]|uniref:Uncharacterized protein n=1 Tax=Actinokineospora terrae TaxID=155974 RepID=A0A1H9T6L1_9PSEU|nr:hypothetical protein [Actinokineospora terrae]SER92890.1 hypothetical protein SAMN04487818_10699 [Actinokineospora terrae]